MSNYDDPNDFLMGGGGAPSFSWKGKPVGTICKGTILDMDVTQQTDMEGKPKFWDDGKPRMQLAVTLQTDLRNGEGMSAPAFERLANPADDDGQRRLFIKAQMQKAVRDAVRAAGQAQMKVGGTLAVQYVSESPAKTAGYDPIKEFRAQYVPPAVGIDDLIDGNGNGNAQVQAPAAPPAPPVAASNLI